MNYITSKAGGFLLGQSLALLSLVFLTDLAAAQSNAVGDYKEINELPIRFIDIYKREDLLIQEPESGFGPIMANNSDQQEVNKVTKIFFAYLSNSARIVSRKSGDSKFRPPLELITSSLTEHSAAAMVKFANGTMLPESHNLKVSVPNTLGRDFDVMDLFGCQVSQTLYDVINSLDIRGTLVLPFAGIDLRKIRRLPSNLRKLVIYNSNISAKLDELAQTIDHLDELVLGVIMMTVYTYQILREQVMS